VENVVFLGQSHHVSGDILGFEIDRNNDVVLTVFGRQLQTSSTVGTRSPANFGSNQLPASSPRFRPRSVRRSCRAVRGSVHGAIVDAHQLAVLGFLHVELEAKAKFETRPEIRQRVLGGVAQQAPVSDDQGTAFGCVGVRTGCDKGEEQQEDSMRCGHG